MATDTDASFEDLLSLMDSSVPYPHIKSLADKISAKEMILFGTEYCSSGCKHRSVVCGFIVAGIYF